MKASRKRFLPALCLLALVAPFPGAIAQTSDAEQQPFMDQLQKSIDALAQSEAADLPEEGIEQSFSVPPISPNVFRTVAVPVSKTRMDDRWARVSKAADQNPLGQFATSAAGLPKRQQASLVQALINRRIRYSSDQENWGQADYWATVDETLSRGAGDCEDIAVIKMHALRQLGVEEKDLYLVVGADDAGRAHALLIMNLEGEFIVLDDRAGRVLRAEEAKNFRPILSFGSGTSWVHGTKAAASTPF